MTNPVERRETPNPVPEETNQQVGEDRSNQNDNQQAGQPEQEAQEDVSMTEAEQETPNGSYTVSSTMGLQEQEAILRKEVEESLALRFKQDNPTARIRAARKKRHEEALDNLKALQSTLQALKPTAEKEVVPRNMPGLQVLGGPQRFEDRDMHESITAFFTAFEAQLHSHSLDLNQHWERLFWQCLDNHQRSWFQRTLHGHGYAWKQAQQHIEKAYGNPCHIWQKGQELYELRHDKYQSIQEYAEEFESLAREAAREEDERLCKDFVYSLHESVRSKLYPVLASNYPKQDPTNLREVALLATRTLGQHMEATNTNTINRHTNKRTRNHDHQVNNQHKNRRRKYGNCPVHKNGSHDKEQCQVLNRIREATQQPKTGYLQAKSSTNTSNTHSNMCRHCHKVPFSYEHLKVCQEYQTKRQGKENIHNRSICVQDTSSSSRSRADEIYDFCAGQLASMDITGNYTCYSLQDNTSDSLLVALTVQIEQVLALVDTGANRSFITPTLAQSINAVINKDILDRTHVSLAQHGSSATLLGLAQNVPLIYNGKKLTHDFLVMELSGTAPVTIGLDLMPKLGIAITGLVATWQQQPKKQETTPSDIPQPNDSPAGSDMQRHSFFNKVQPTIDRNAKIPKNTFCTVPQSVIKLTTKDEDAVVHRRQYPLPIASQQRVKEQVETWIRDGVVEPVTQPTMWNSPITLAPKKDLFGNYTDKRPCLDPRHINRLLVEPDRHPLPLINEIYAELRGAKVFTTLDLRSAFHRFEIYEPDRPKTAFKIEGFPQLMFRGCPFGLKPISSTFQRTMDIVFANMPYVKTFVDDIIIFSNNIEEHAQHVAAAIDKLTSVNLILNPDKCHFAQKAVYLLGFCISEQGKSLDTRKVTNVQDWPTPKTGKDIQRFLGVINYFREHIPKAADLMAPLDKLRNAHRLDRFWSSSKQQAFDNLKQILLEAPVLCHPDLNHPFQVATDASNTGIGAVLYQVINGKTHHIGFMARALSPSERNYSTTKRELLAIVFALNKFHKYLWGNPFTLYTDHKALVYMHTQKIANPMMIGWLETILEYQFNIVHLPGLDNTLPDQLSRLFPTAKELAGDNATHKHGTQSTSVLNNSIDVNDNDTSKLHSSQDDGTDNMFTPPESERKTLLLEAHAFGHFGAKAMVNYLHNNGLHWSNMHREAQGIVHSCPQCQRHNIAKVGYHPLRPIHAYLPGDHWAIDLASFPTSRRGNNYLLVMVDVCTRFCVLHALPDKSSDTVVQAVIHTFCDYGFPRYLQSDNGTEFVNTLMHKLKESAGFDHRLATPYHPRANGLAERFVQTTTNVIRKNVDGATQDWDLYVKPIQLALNNKVASYHGTTPFALMFNRAMNGFRDYSNDDIPRPLTEEELMDRIDLMSKTVFPAISERATALAQLKKGKHDAKYRIIKFPEGSKVMIKDMLRSKKLDPRYEGPYTVVRQTQGGSYVLRDEQGLLASRNFAPSQLKLVSRMNCLMQVKHMKGMVSTTQFKQLLITKSWHLENMNTG